MRFPAKFILGFCRNHGLLQICDRPQWLTIANRSQNLCLAAGDVRCVIASSLNYTGSRSSAKSTGAVQLRFG